MTRKAILLSASPLSVPIAGAESDTEPWYHFLRSNAGGAWSDQEITRLNNPDRDATLAAVRTAKDADYSLLVFAGRGQVRKGDVPWPEAHTLLGDGGSVSEADLNPGTPRCTLVFDWSNGASTQPGALGRGADQAGNQFRALFDQALQKAEGGLVKIFASQTDAAAPHGLSFSSLLLHAAQEWTRTNHGTLSLQQAVSLVADATPKTAPTLKAEYQGGRRLHHFPLAVSI